MSRGYAWAVYSPHLLSKFIQSLKNIFIEHYTAQGTVLGAEVNKTERKKKAPAPMQIHSSGDKRKESSKWTQQVPAGWRKAKPAGRTETHREGVILYLSIMRRGGAPGLEEELLMLMAGGECLLSILFTTDFRMVANCPKGEWILTLNIQ